METYAKALLYAIPFFIVLVLAEIAYGYFFKKIEYRAMDTVSSISSGLTNIIKDSLGIALVIVSYPFLLEHLAVFTIKSTWATYAVAFIALDFAGYWNHRLSHRVNLFWNQHVIHHSSEEFNLACALRQPISNLIGYYPLLLIPAAVVGVPEKVIVILAPLHLFLQFWYHTKHIGKMGWLEYILVTPSQHRVHHAINPMYIDKNLGQIFSVWDRLFGTFQEELKSEPPVYGVLKPAATWNPVIINFQHLFRLIKDAWHTNSMYDKLRIWFMPTGWRPDDVKERFPVKTVENVYELKKYETSPSKALIYYSVFQMVISIALLIFMFYNYPAIGFTNLLLYGAIIFLGIFGYTELMNKNKHAFWVEIFRTSLGIYVIAGTGNWFGLNEYITYGSAFVASYFFFSALGAAYFCFIERKFSATG